MNLLYVAKCK